MQQEAPRRSNRDRSDATTAQLLAAARALFVERGYADTATPDIVAAAGVTRGALYHHFADKKALFQAVVEREAAAVAADIERASPATLAARAALIAGGDAFLAAMAAPGRVRLLLLDGPAVLGRPGMDAIDAAHGMQSLKQGLAAAMRDGGMREAPLDALASLLSAAFDRAALDIDQGASADACRRAIAALIDGMFEAGAA